MARREVTEVNLRGAFKILVSDFTSTWQEFLESPLSTFCGAFGLIAIALSFALTAYFWQDQQANKTVFGSITVKTTQGSNGLICDQINLFTYFDTESERIYALDNVKLVKADETGLIQLHLKEGGYHYNSICRNAASTEAVQGGGSDFVITHQGLILAEDGGFGFGHTTKR